MQWKRQIFQAVNTLTGGTPGPQTQFQRVACTIAKHRGSRVKAAGTREARSGRRRDYWCFPAGGKQHKLAVIIHAPDRIVPSYSTPPECPTHGVDGTVVRDGT